MSTFALQDEDLCQALRRRVKHYKKDHPALSSQQIAKRFNMSSSTLNRIENQDIKNPTIDQVLKVLRGTGETNDLLSFIEEYYPDIAETYKDAYSHNSDNEFISNEAEHFFRDEETYLIMLLAYTGLGTTEEEVYKELGEKGRRTLSRLVDMSILKESSNGIFYTKDLNAKMSQEVTKKLLLNTIDHCYQSELIGKLNNFLSIQTESINKKGAEELTRILKNAYSDINEVLTSEKFDGDLKFFVGLTSDCLNYREV